MKEIRWSFEDITEKWDFNFTFLVLYEETLLISL